MFTLRARGTQNKLPEDWGDDGVSRHALTISAWKCFGSAMPYKLGVIAMTSLNHLLRGFAVLALLVCVSLGCGQSASPAADPEPFKTAVAKYLEQNNMAMALSRIKAGPTIEGKTATLTASLQHATIPGPAVTWTFRFEQNADGTWNAVSHK